jgi:hypothetical protein
MSIDAHSVLAFVHILLFGYWLGADLGVFFCDSQLKRDDLSLDERLRVRRIRYKVDMAPRTCFVLILAVGFSLAVRYGSPVTGTGLALVWIGCLAWLALIWIARLKADTPEGKWLSKLDRAIWWIVGGAMIGVGAAALLTGAPVAAPWLGAKMLLYGIIAWNGIWIMRVGDRWYGLFAMVRAGGNERARGEALIKVNRNHAAAAAGTLWFIVLVVAFLGRVKPF